MRGRLSRLLLKGIRMLREYELNGFTFQFEEGEHPEGAQLVSEKSDTKPVDDSKASKAPNKSKSPSNK